MENEIWMPIVCTSTLVFRNAYWMNTKTCFSGSITGLYKIYI